ncbi:hydrogen gas-evolving membrane-bound hydrogenase subunit E [Acuticoccus sediminis]|uniref:hydrogen gas-evolving membrane-bound hydrogenase subunit E n=1 Tax=Acuticoccus sediminis TaxID=2184697 RepID=UPI00192E5730|nr:hydrogen gas-evolving membrane-bound hydrogenase subunit E [Acuticoccus sediminis]
MLFVVVLLLCAGAAIVARPVCRILGRWGAPVLAGAPLAAFVLLLREQPAIAGGEVLLASAAWVPTLGVDLAFRLDGFSLLFALLVTGIGTLVTLYAGAYFAEKPPATAGRFLSLILLFMTAMLGTVLADNLVVMFLFWEATSLLSFMLVGFDSEKAEARRAALQALIVTGGGGLTLFAGILLIGITLGTFSYTEVLGRADELVASPWLTPIIVLILLGAFTKSAQVPFQFWLPNAMQAPTPASAYLHSATMVKLGVFLLARFDQVFAGVPWFGGTLVVVGSLTMLVASFEALRATGFKAVLAQSTVASLGILVMLIGLDSEVAVVATVGFLITHAFYKAALFFCAGNAIHATGEAHLSRLGGLARVLPFTAFAALLASFSMAGLPPFIGFISKEYLFDAQLSSTWSVAPVLVAVIVNSVMVGVAGVVSIRPFFMARRRTLTIRHGETPGLLIGPLALAIGGIALGIVPNVVAATLIAPAVLALTDTPVDVSFSLWHGVTPMLVLSGLVITMGILIAVFWTPIHVTLRRRRILHRLFGDRFYERAFNGTLALASRSTQVLQNGDQHRYTAVVVTSTVAILAVGLLVSGTGLPFVAQGPLRVSVVAVLAIAVAGAVATTLARSLVGALVSVGIVGFASAFVFLLNGAPDLALTQFSVETLLVVILTAVLLRVPLARAHSRTPSERRRDAFIAALFAVFVFVGAASMSATPPNMELSAFFGAASYLEAYGRNVVNVILVDFRAIDTLGEVAVVAFATLAAWALLRRGGAPRPLKTKG